MSHLLLFRDLYVAPLELRDEPWKAELLRKREVAVFLSTVEQIVQLNTQFLAEINRRVWAGWVPLPPPPGRVHSRGAVPTLRSLDHSKRGADGSEADRLKAELPSPAVCIGDVFLQFAPLFKLYGEYASYHEAASQALDDLEESPNR